VLSSNVGCIQASNVRYSFSYRFGHNANTMTGQMVSSSQVKLFMPMFFARGNVEMIVSFDSGSTYPVNMPLTIISALGSAGMPRLETSVDFLDYILPSTSSLSFTWDAQLLGGEGNVSIHAYSYADGNNLKYPDINFLSTVKSAIANTGSAGNVDISSVGTDSLALIFRIVKTGENSEQDKDFFRTPTSVVPLLSKPVVRNQKSNETHMESTFDVTQASFHP